MPEQPIMGGVPMSAEAKCPLCGEQLVITRHDSRMIFLSDTPADLRAGAEVSVWEIGCTGGHVLLLPPDNGGDRQEFGSCTCQPGDDPETVAMCAHNDPARLRALLNMTQSPAATNG